MLGAERKLSDLDVYPLVKPPVFPVGCYAMWPVSRLAGPPITDPLMIATAKATLLAWAQTAGVSPPLTNYGGDPSDLSPMWTMRDGIMLHSFSIWWNGSGYKPQQTTGTGSPAQAALDQEHANALASWAGQQAGGTKIPTSQPPIPTPPGGLPIPAPPGWPSGAPWPVPQPDWWPPGLQWPPLATSSPPFGWPAQWPWPPSPTNPPPGLPWPPPGWPATIPLPIPIPTGWTQPSQPTPPSTPTQPPLPAPPTQPTLPPAQSTTTTAKKSSAIWWIGGAAALAALVLLNK